MLVLRIRKMCLVGKLISKDILTSLNLWRRIRVIVEGAGGRKKEYISIKIWKCSTFETQKFSAINLKMYSFFGTNLLLRFFV